MTTKPGNVNIQHLENVLLTNENGLILMTAEKDYTAALSITVDTNHM